MARPEPQRERDDVGDETSEDSFPASDPPRYRSQAVGGPSLDADALPPGAPAGLTYRDDFITPDEERALLRHIDHVDFSDVRFPRS